MQSELCCTRLAESTGRKNSPKIRHLRTITQLCGAISSQLRYVSTIGKLDGCIVQNTQNSVTLSSRRPSRRPGRRSASACRRPVESWSKASCEPVCDQVRTNLSATCFRLKKGRKLVADPHELVESLAGNQVCDQVYNLDSVMEFDLMPTIQYSARSAQLSVR